MSAIGEALAADQLLRRAAVRWSIIAPPPVPGATETGLPAHGNAALATASHEQEIARLQRSGRHARERHGVAGLDGHNRVGA